MSGIQIPTVHGFKILFAQLLLSNKALQDRISQAVGPPGIWFGWQTSHSQSKQALEQLILSGINFGAKFEWQHVAALNMRQNLSGI